MSRPRTFLAVALIASVACLAASADAAPKKKKKPQETTQSSGEKPVVAVKVDTAGEFDRQAAASAIMEVSLQKCKATNATKGEGHVTITFAPAGNVQTVQVDRGPWLGTPVAKCMAKEFKKAKVPAFKGEAVTVGKLFQFE